MASKVFNVALVGYGASAKTFHIPLIKAVSDLRVYGVVQRNPTAENDANKDLGVKVYRSVEELAQDTDVDVVIVNTPPNTHYDITMLLLENNKNVIVEKPFVPTSAEAEKLAALAKEKHRLLTVYQNRRWDSDYLTISKLVRDDTLGRIVEFETHFDRYRLDPPTGWKASGLGSGVIYDLGTHLLDQVIHLFGWPKEVTAFLVNQRESGVEGFEDSATILLHYDGLIATIKAAVVSPESEQLRFWVRGTKGSYKKYHLDIQEEQLKAGKDTQSRGFGEEPESRYGVLSIVDENNSISSKPHPTLKPETWSKYYQIMAEALAGKGSPPVSIDDAVRLIRLIELAQQSSKEKRTLAFSE